MNLCPHCGSYIIFLWFTACGLSMFGCVGCTYTFVIIAGRRCAVLKGASGGLSNP